MLRVLRPLRSITRLEGLKVIVNSLLASLPLLGNTLIVVAFYFLIFGIVGVQLWHGTLRYRCYWDGGNATNLTGPVPTRACVAPGSGVVGQWGDGSAVKAGFLPVLNTTLVEGPRYDAALFDEGFVCMGNPGNTSYSDDWVVTPPRGGCPVNHSCLCYGENPNFGLTSFDDMNFAFLNIFTYMTLEGWAEAMYVGRGRRDHEERAHARECDRQRWSKRGDMHFGRNGIVSWRDPPCCVYRYPLTGPVVLVYVLE